MPLAQILNSFSAKAAAPLRRRNLLLGAAALPWMTHAAPAPINGYPVRPLKLVIPFAAGSIGDLFMRPVGQELGQAIGQPMVIDNKPGASAAIGAELVARAAPDGYTLLLGTQAGLILNSLARKKLPYDPFTDFTPITMMFVTPMYLYVNPSVGAKTVPELIALAKANPGKLTFGSIGPGTSQHLLGEMFKTMAGVDMLHVPFKGGPEATNALVSGQIDLYFNGANGMSFVKQGKVNVIASCGLKRSEERPSLPTVAESGLPGFEVLPWFGLFAPAGLPRPLVDRLNQEFVAQLKTPAMKEKATQLGVEIITGTPEALTAQMKSQYGVMGEVMRRAGIQAE